jgi:Protein of unknown function (DUF2840)
MTAPVFLRQQAARASRQDPHDSTIDVALELTHVDVLWIRRRVVSFAPDSIFAFLRWVSNAYGSVQSRIDILCAVAPGESYAPRTCTTTATVCCTFLAGRGSRKCSRRSRSSKRWA